MIIRLGELALSDVVPLLATMQASLQVAVGVGITELSGKLEGLAGVLAAITLAPPDVGGTITAALQTVASLQLAISGPTVSLEAAAILGLMAELNAQLGALTAAADLSIPGGALSAYVYLGPTAAFGPELQAAVDASLPGAPAHTYALVLATTSAPAWASASLVLRTA